MKLKIGNLHISSPHKHTDLLSSGAPQYRSSLLFLGDRKLTLLFFVLEQNR